MFRVPEAGLSRQGAEEAVSASSQRLPERL